MMPPTDLQVKVVAVDLSLRDLFAMHAPEVPAWFNPELPACPQHPPAPDSLPENLAALVSNWLGDPASYDLLDAVKGEAERALLAPWLKARSEADLARRAWLDLRNRERLVQWRWYYADAMLRGREAART
jgi:hypothetical protein